MHDTRFVDGVDPSHHDSRQRQALIPRHFSRDAGILQQIRQMFPVLNPFEHLEKSSPTEACLEKLDEAIREVLGIRRLDSTLDLALVFDVPWVPRHGGRGQLVLLKQDRFTPHAAL